MHQTAFRIFALILTFAASAPLAVAADGCGEATCVAVQGTYISHFTGANCDGTESYYLPYDNFGFQCRTWDGQGRCGTTRRTVTNRSYSYNGVCKPNVWPSGNTLSNFVTVYRTGCSEPGCIAPQGAYISHFTGARCDGIESYYLPYDGFAYQCRPWDGGGVCGTIHRTVTNRSYAYNGVCHPNAWPGGNTLSDFVTVYRGTDNDLDGLPDATEMALAQEYFPVLNLHCGTFEGMAYADRRQLYGLNVPGYSNASNGKIPFVAHPYTPGNGTDCREPSQCIEIRYGIAWNWDLGDDFFGGAHRGDSETYAILLAHKDTDGSDWGTTLGVALSDPTRWRLIKEFMSAHWTATGDSSSFRTHGNSGTTSIPRVWCAEGKHGMYPTQDACNNGGFADIDDCSDNRCDIVSDLVLKLQNVGEPGTWLDPEIPYPGASKTTPPSGTYNVWSGTAFGSATDYRSHLTRSLAWCPARCY